MNKQEFLKELRGRLAGLPEEDIDERLTFYGEMIEDRIEEGLSEEEAVSAIGSVDEIATQTIADIPLSKIAKERIKPKRRLKTWETVLLAVGSPIWFSLGIAAVSVIFALYISLWAVLVSLWAVFGSLALCAVGTVPACVVFALGGNLLSGLILLSAGFICGGLAILMFFACSKTTKGILILTKKFAMFIKNCFIKKGEAK